MAKVVAFLDVLGFKSRLKREGLTASEAVYRRLKSEVEKISPRMMLNCAVPVEGGRVAAFGTMDIDQDLHSDGIFLWSNYNSFCFPPFCGVLQELLCCVLEMGIPLRGGVAVGSAVMNKPKRIYLGEALSEAVEVEKAQEWIGVSFGPSFATPPFNWFEPDQVLVYRAHRKMGMASLVPGAVLDWPRKWRDTRLTPAQSTLIQLNTDPKFAKYYENTIQFIDFSERNKNWYRGGSISVRN